MAKYGLISEGWDLVATRRRRPTWRSIWWVLQAMVYKGLRWNVGAGDRVSSGELSGWRTNASSRLVSIQFQMCTKALLSRIFGLWIRGGIGTSLLNSCGHLDLEACRGCINYEPDVVDVLAWNPSP
ncbi:hypothetical protein V2J09_006715 [Rumex salicifolius]